MFTSPGDIAFHIGNISVYYYGIIMAISLLVGVFTARFIISKFYSELNPDIIYDIAPIIIICAILGARSYYCTLCWGYYSSHISEIPQLWHGGLSIHGAILGGLIGGIAYAKIHKLPVLKLCDVFSYGLILGQALGRWGNFFNSEAFGRPTQNFLKLYIPLTKRPIEYMQYSFFHPTFLYESILNVLVFLTLYFVIRKIANGKDGIVFFSYLILYSLVRLFIESLRIDSVLNIYGIPIAQLVSVFIIIISLLAIIVRVKISNKS